MSSFLFRSVSKLTVSFPSRNISRRTLQTSTAKVTPFYTNSINTCFGNNNLNSLTIGKRNFHAARINQQHVASLSSIISLTTIKFSLATQSRRALTNITYAQLKQRNIMSVTGHLLSPNNVYPNRDYSSNSSSHDKNDVSESTTTAINSEHSNSHPELTRWSWAWWKEWTIIFIVFGITGSTTVRCVRPLVSNLFGIE
ncbi:5711_t:CDS:1, partial [Ambispora leptoticha]